MFDLVLQQGTVIDGTKKARFQADVGITGDRITAVGDLREAQAKVKKKIAGKIIAPGFIDVHNHTDGWLIKEPLLSVKTSQGFTTEVIMSDGISYAPVSPLTAPHWMFYLRALNGLRMDEYEGWTSIADYMQHMDGYSLQNAIAQVPYANVRTLCCGFGPKKVNDLHRRIIVNEVRRSMEEGACALSTGLDYIAQCHCTTDDLVDACVPVAEFGGLYVTHIRYKLGMLEGIKEAVEIGKRTGVKVHISHLKEEDPGHVDELLGYIDNVARKEVDFSFDAYPYQPGSTMLSYLLPYECFDDGPLAVASKLHDPEIRYLFRKTLETYPLDLDHIHIAWVQGKENSIHQGKTLAQFVEERGLPAEEALLELLIEERLGVLLVFDQGDDKWIHPILQHDLMMIGSDGIYFPESVVHPRVAGTATRFIGPLVRDNKLFSLEEAIYKMTSYPAARFGLKNRGVLKEGNYADLVIFDAESVTDNATMQDSLRPSTGIDHVFVNGVPVVTEGTPIQEMHTPRPGRWLKFNRE
ncbi:MAG: amidohydrolase family protein [Planctomycetota bacterium]|nr:amidohydrolase family protein [Planctomycetota bacterium]